MASEIINRHGGSPKCATQIYYKSIAFFFSSSFDQIRKKRNMEKPQSKQSADLSAATYNSVALHLSYRKGKCALSIANRDEDDAGLDICITHFALFFLVVARRRVRAPNSSSSRIQFHFKLSGAQQQQHSLLPVPNRYMQNAASFEFISTSNSYRIESFLP